MSAAALVAAAIVARTLLEKSESVTNYFFQRDVVVLIAMGIALLTVRMFPAHALWSRWGASILRHPCAAVSCTAGTTAAIALVGAFLLGGGYPLSRDEAMAEFDTTVFLHGELIAQVAPEWRPFVPALEPEFRLAVPGHAAWISSYLPGNAALRALVGSLATPALTNPLLAGVAIVALFGVARRLWPDRPDAALVGTLLLATSPQVLTMAMTPYAMTSHLTLNLVWLWLFLRGGRWAHGAAAAIGLLACGLHQMIFHPLFVAPFILQLCAQRRWRLVSFYVTGYTLVAAFWTIYWHLVVVGAGIEPAQGSQTGLLLERVLYLLGNFEWSGLDTMAKNICRLIAWQNVLVVPLAVFGAVMSWRLRGPERPLALGILLTTLAMFVLLPYQGHGWGYRYLHGLTGSLCLLAAQGWIVLTANHGSRASAWTTLGPLVAVSLFVFFPAQVLLADRFIARYASAAHSIRNARADVVIVDSSGISFGVDLVRNDPFLRHTPKIMALRELDEIQLRSLCARFRVALFDRAAGASFGIPTHEATPDPEARPKLRLLMRELSCGGGIWTAREAGASRSDSAATALVEPR